jgi:hypothetical protein
MSDGPIKLAPADGHSSPPGPGDQDAPALDDIILGDDDLTVPTPAVHARSSVAPLGGSKDSDALAKAIESGTPGTSGTPAVPGASGTTGTVPADRE